MRRVGRLNAVECQAIAEVLHLSVRSGAVGQRPEMVSMAAEAADFTCYKYPLLRGIRPT